MSTRHIPTHDQMTKLAWSIAFYVGHRTVSEPEIIEAVLQRKGKAWRHCIDLQIANTLNQPLPTFTQK